METTKETQARYRRLSTFWKVISALLSAGGIVLAVLQIFYLTPLGFALPGVAYYYYLIGFFVSLVFIIIPAARSAPRDRVPWYDILLFLVCLGICVYFAVMTLTILGRGWEYSAPLLPTALAICLWFLVIEATRRAGGLILAAVCAFFSFYPLFAEGLPGLLQGAGLSFFITARYHAMGLTSLLGLPLQTVGSLLIGFMLFGVVLQLTGGGEFFLNLALGLMGKTRGGAAKVSVVSSCLFGTMSGSVISNVLVTGSFTIPTMKKTGFPAYFAAAVEAVSSTGGALMPPIMGTVAFIMASFLGVPYSTIVVAAIIPALLYYGGLFFTVDCFAAKKNMKGLPPSEIPSLRKTFKEGWFFILALVLLIALVFVARTEGQAPFYTMAALFICALIKERGRLGFKMFLDFFKDSGKLMAEVTAILAGVGLIIGAFSVTGVAHAFSSELVNLAGNNLYLLLIIGALASFILGMGMTASACYIFLALTLAPALITLGLNPLAVHLFVLYWGLVSFITPPVAIGAIAAASLGGASPMKTGYTAMKLGSVIYFVPFFFVLNPALILIGSPLNIVFSVVTAFIGVYFIAAGLQGYCIGIGTLNPPARILSGLAGLALFAPWRASEIVGAAILAFMFAYSYISKRREARRIETAA